MWCHLTSLRHRLKKGKTSRHRMSLMQHCTMWVHLITIKSLKKCHGIRYLACNTVVLSLCGLCWVTGTFMTCTQLFKHLVTMTSVWTTCWVIAQNDPLDSCKPTTPMKSGPSNAAQCVYKSSESGDLSLFLTDCQIIQQLPDNTNTPLTMLSSLACIPDMPPPCKSNDTHCSSACVTNYAHIRQFQHFFCPFVQFFFVCLFVLFILRLRILSIFDFFFPEVKNN